MMSALNNCRMQTLRCRQHGPALMTEYKTTDKRHKQRRQPALGQFRFRPKPKLITVRPTETETRPKVPLLSDSVPKPKFGRRLDLAASKTIRFG